MSSKTSASGMAGSSGGTPRYDAQQVRANRKGKLADEYARDKLGITGPNVMNTPAGTLVTKGFTSSTVPNQMYGTEYSAARNEYLASQGLGSVTDTGQYRPFVKTDKGMVSTSLSRASYEASRKIPIPLSQQMFESQQRFTAGIAAVAALAGVPVIPSALYLQSRTPYQKYLSNNKQIFSYTSGSNQSQKDSNQKSEDTTEMAPPVGDNLAEQKETKRKNYLASLKTSKNLEGDRKFITGSQRGFGNTYSV